MAFNADAKYKAHPLSQKLAFIRRIMASSAAKLSPPLPSIASASRRVWLPPLRYSLPVIMLVSGLVLICTETALFLAFQERRAIDSVWARAERDGPRLARMAGQFFSESNEPALLRELEATRREPGLVRVEVLPVAGAASLQPRIGRLSSGSEIEANVPIPGAQPPALIHMVFDLASAIAEAREIAWKQALITASVLALGALLLWIALDSAIAKRAERIVANARAISSGQPPGQAIGGDDELAQIDQALRDAHALINQQASDLKVRAEQLEERTRERSRLEQEIIQISEREQRRIGQDLHDDVCQRLAAVKMKIQDHEEKLASVAPSLIADAEAIAGDLAGAIQVTRALARGLSPVELDSGGIVIALSGLAKASSEVFGIDCRFIADDPLPDLPPSTAHQLYRIAQECIANAAKHARARRVTISLRSEPNGLALRVANDGQPMSAADGIAEGMGLSIMRHRAESIAASLEFETAPADATTAVHCVLQRGSSSPQPTPTNP